MFLSALILHFLLPHTTNNQKARLLHPVFVGISLLIFLATQLLMPFLPYVSPVVLGYASDIPPERIIELANKEREKAGVPALRLDPLLTQAALAKGSDMLARDYWAHVAPDGTQPWYFFTSTGYTYRFAGENLARDFPAPEGVVAAWMDSPTHRENLLAAKYEDIGVAVVEGDLGGVETTLVVQLFGTKFSGGQASLTEVSPGPEQTLSPTQLGGSTVTPRKILVSPFSSTRRIALFFVSLFITLFSIDIAIVNQRKIVRTSSRSLAHLFFFGMIFLVVYFAQAGLIL